MRTINAARAGDELADDELKRMADAAARIVSLRGRRDDEHTQAVAWLTAKREHIGLTVLARLVDADSANLTKLIARKRKPSKALLAKSPPCDRRQHACGMGEEDEERCPEFRELIDRKGRLPAQCTQGSVSLTPPRTDKLQYFPSVISGQNQTEESSGFPMISRLGADGRGFGMSDSIH